MCGLSGVVVAYRPDATADLSPLARAAAGLASWDAASASAADVLERACAEAEPAAVAALGWAGLRALVQDEPLRARAREAASAFQTAAEAIDRRLAQGKDGTAAAEKLAAAATRARDLAWRVEKDALQNGAKVIALDGSGVADKLLFELWRTNLILNQLERLEVRGRDSGGFGTIVHVADQDVAAFEEKLERAAPGELARRRAIKELRDGAVLVSQAHGGRALAFVHKVAREVGELGSNVREIRAKARKDALWRAAVGDPRARVISFAHTRWASNGIINEANCHPLSNEIEGGTACAPASAMLPRVVLGALNGDIDNYAEIARRLERETGRAIPATITTDAKVIPVEVDRFLASSSGPASFEKAFQDALRSFEGSTAVAAIGSDAPGAIGLGLRGSGQAIYLGRLAEGGFIFGSELYALVEVAERTYKLNGDVGEVVFLDEKGMRLARWDGAPVTLAEKDWKRAQITTRDIDRAGFEHYLLKEIGEAPTSIKKTLRGKFVIEPPSRARSLLGDDVIPPAARAALAAGAVRKIFVIGQGTACVAARAVADFLGTLLGEKTVDVRGMPATELSGFHLDRVDARTIVIAISQSGTTTDTNRTVDLARERGAQVIAVVNRRHSDLVDKSHGVLYTSDGRDIEMSVASTKAFYCQVVAGYLLSIALAAAAGAVDLEHAPAIVRLLHELEALPQRMQEVLAQARDRVRAAAQLALTRRHWALTGSGPLRHGADEVRIKLSELCYKSIAVDTIEDKKHIDLSSEPLVLACAAGLSGAAAADAVKEVAILRAHYALPIVVCDRGESRFGDYAALTIEVPPCSPPVALLLDALVGHLFGYECARAIDAQASPLKRAREATEAALAAVRAAANEPGAFSVQETLERYRVAVSSCAKEALDACAKGRWNAALDPDVALRVANALKNAQALAIPDEKQLEHVLLELTRGIDALRRPIDAIKHQAKTVTVGISRDAPAARAAKGKLVDALAEAGVDTAQLIEPDGAALMALGLAVASVDGTTVYRVTGLDPLGAPLPEARIEALKKTGTAERMRSRADRGAPLTGTKRKLVSAPRVHVGRGMRDGRSLVICPLYERGVVSGLALLHVTFSTTLTTRERARALRAAGRYEDVRCGVTEVDVSWDDRLLDSLPVDELLTDPAERLAERIVEIAKSAGETPPAKPQHQVPRS